jgi:hypothetical protein
VRVFVRRFIILEFDTKIKSIHINFGRKCYNVPPQINSFTL